MLNNEVFGYAFESLPNAVMIVKFSIKRAYVLYANPALERLIGYRLSEIKDKDLIGILLSGTANIPSDIEKFRQGFLSKKNETHLLKCTNKDNISFSGRFNIAPMQNDQNMFVVALEDISSEVILQKQLTEAKQKHDLVKTKLDQLSKTDSLTGVYNPKAINHELSILFNSAKRNYGSFSLLFIEIDKLNDIEKEYGTGTINKCIEHFAKTLTRNFRRRSDIIIRYSHEQFLVCFAGANDAQTYNLADKILQSIQSIPVVLSATQKINLTLSIGMLNTVVNLESNLDHTIGVANLAVEKAKKKGGNQIYTANGSLS